MEHWYQKISMFFVEIHLDVVLEVLLMVGLNFISTKLVDRYHRKIYWENQDDWFINGGDI